MRPGKVWPASWLWDALLAALFVALTIAVARGAFLGWDLAVRNWSDAHRPGALYWLARAGNELGQGGFFAGVAGVLALWVAWRLRSLWPVPLVLVAFVLTFGTLTPLKAWTDRAAPHTFALAHPEHFGSGGASYPAGHLTNALVWYGVLALLLSPWLGTGWQRAIRVAPAALLCLTTVYLGFHWLTDTVAGLLLGLLLDRVIRRIPWRIPVRAARSAPGSGADPGSDPGTAAHDP